MDFAKSTLEKHGWKSGQGLGKDQQGIKEAIKVKIKKDTAGVGHQPGEEFTFHWWDHIFNKAANNLNVENSEDGVQVQKISDVNVSRKKPLGKVLDNKEMLYGRFVKAATLTNGLETPQASDSSSDSDGDEDSEIHTKISHLTDEELLKICGGRTAHKGARHGIQMNGKLARIEQQEKILASQSDSCRSSPAPDDDSSGKKKKKRTSEEMSENDTTEVIQKKKKKKKRNKEKAEDCVEVESDKKEKKKKRDRTNESSDEIVEESAEQCSEKQKKKKKRKELESTCSEDANNTNNDDNENTDNSENSTDTKKKKKKSKQDITITTDDKSVKKSKKHKKKKSKCE